MNQAVSIAWIVVAGFLSSAMAAGDDGPFIAAWDRFGKYGEVSSELSTAVLISELSCTACHASDNPAYQPKAGPKLNDVGSRLNADWVQDFLTDPSRHRKGTTMPDVLSEESAEHKSSSVEALTAYLMSLDKPLQEVKGSGANPVPLEFWKNGNVNRGRELFHSSGCVACHEPDSAVDVSHVQPSSMDRMLKELDPEDLVELRLEAAARKVNSVPHPDFHQKYSVKSLTWFLMNPESVRPSGRMPHLGLRAVDAADLAAYLTARSQSKSESNNRSTEQNERLNQKDLIQKGALLFQQKGCANCHQSQNSVRVKFPSLAKVANQLQSRARPSCITNPDERMPHYHLTLKQSEQLIQGLGSIDSSMKTNEVLQLTLLQQNCYACHQRDDHGGVGRYRKAYFETIGQIDIGDEGRFPPPLTGVGEKLTSARIKDVFRGRGPLRSFMTIRMPQYPDAITKQLPRQFAAIDHPAPFASEERVFKRSNGLEEPGRRLMDAGCVQCHVFKGESLPGTVGVDLAGITERVHPEWLRDFLLNPGSKKRGTRMPTFFPGGKSQNPTILDGHTEKQVDAIYAYLKKIDQLPLPQKIANVRNQDFELRPKDRPIVFRTFMPIAGTHAIAIGYPEKVHAAFDAENLFFAEFWRGRFLDAQGTWYVRALPPANPLGTDRVTLPKGPSFAWLPSANTAWPSKCNPTSDRFDGYVLNETGVPRLRYHFGDAVINDQVNAEADGSMTRTIKFDVENHKSGDQPDPAQRGPTQQLWFRAHQGKNLTRIGPEEFEDESGLKVKITGLEVASEQLVRQGSSVRWLIPVDWAKPTTIRIRYRW